MAVLGNSSSQIFPPLYQITCLFLPRTAAISKMWPFLQSVSTLSCKLVIGYWETLYSSCLTYVRVIITGKITMYLCIYVYSLFLTCHISPLQDT
ncbi:hypothetical protein VNO78_13615 [Psophocarpus tetragonolobus]|uniref:Uncharacterized protein n=1 Tax=Psophocarpus tetragonolobus TaxID=3891 RepID=A0AAN9SQA0_PSOTE